MSLDEVATAWTQTSVFNELLNNPVGDFWIWFVFLEGSQQYEAEIQMCSGSSLLFYVYKSQLF